MGRRAVTAASTVISSLAPGCDGEAETYPVPAGVCSLEITAADSGGGGGAGSFNSSGLNSSGGDGFVTITPIANTCPVEAVIRFTG